MAFAAGVTLVGERVQGGAPVVTLEQLSATAEEKPLKDITVTVKLAGLPALTVADEGAEVSVKSGGRVPPMPASVTC